MDEIDFLNAVKKVADLSESDSSAPISSGNTKMYFSGKWYNLKWDNMIDDPVNSLDVSILQENLLSPILGINDQEQIQELILLVVLGAMLKLRESSMMVQQ